MKYLCRAPDFDVPNTWTEVQAGSHWWAAERFAEDFDEGCPEHFKDPIRDGLAVEVKEPGENQARKFNVTFDYSKSFNAEELASAESV